MKKGYIVSFILGAIIFSGVTVLATNAINANEVTYKNTTLDSALDTLYERSTYTEYAGSVNITINPIPPTYKELNTLTNELTSSDLLSGKQAYKADGTIVNGNVSTFTPASSYTPTTSAQTLSTNGKYVDGNIIIEGVSLSNLTETYSNIANLDHRPTATSVGLSLTKGSYVCEIVYSLPAYNEAPGQMYKDISSSFSVSQTGCDNSSEVTSLSKLQYAQGTVYGNHLGTVQVLSVFKCELNSNKNITVNISASENNNQAVLATLVCTKYSSN